MRVEPTDLQIALEVLELRQPLEVLILHGELGLRRREVFPKLSILSLGKGNRQSEPDTVNWFRKMPTCSTGSQGAAPPGNHPYLARRVRSILGSQDTFSIITRFPVLRKAGLKSILRWITPMPMALTATTDAPFLDEPTLLLIIRRARISQRGDSEFEASTGEIGSIGISTYEWLCLLGLSALDHSVLILHSNISVFLTHVILGIAVLILGNPFFTMGTNSE